jgi:hypothetical protein
MYSKYRSTNMDFLNYLIENKVLITMVTRIAYRDYHSAKVLVTIHRRVVRKPSFTERVPEFLSKWAGSRLYAKNATARQWEDLPHLPRVI